MAGAPVYTAPAMAEVDVAGSQPRTVARVDERRTMFARAARRPGTPSYEDTYRRWPELQAADDRLRALPAPCAPGGRYYDPVVSAEAETYFAAIDRLVPDADEVDRWAARLAGTDARPPPTSTPTTR